MVKREISQLWMRLSRSGLPFETLKSGSLEVGIPAGSAKGFILKVSTLLLIFQWYRFKFSPEGPPPTKRIESPTV